MYVRVGYFRRQHIFREMIHKIQVINILNVSLIRTPDSLVST